MDIEVLAAWGEFLGGTAGVVAAIGVISTLLYLTRQIRQNTVQIRSQVAQGVMTALRNQANSVNSSTEIAEMYYTGLQSRDALSEAQKFHFNSINIGFYRVFEEAFLHHKAGRLEDAYWNSLSGQLRQVLNVEGIVNDWQDMMGKEGESRGARNNFDLEFVDYVNRLIEQRG